MSNSNLIGYIIKHSWQTNLYSTNTHSEQYTIPLTTFIDDTNWIVDNQKKLKTTLKVADSFNCLNDIQINDDKAVLITTQIPDNEQSIILDLE